jgi:hypothetical protein
MDGTPKFRNVSNPAAFGAEWVTGDHRYQLVNSRGTASLMFGMFNADHGRWYNTSVTAPERFGMTGAPKSWREFAAVVSAFLAEQP